MIRPEYLRWFILFLFITSVVEIAGLILTAKRINNTRLYNVFTPLEYLFYSYIFYQSISSKMVKRFILAFILVYPLLTLTNQMFIQGFKSFHSYTYLLGAFFIVLWSIIYLNQILRSEASENPLNDILFWISAGLLFFYACNFPYLMMMNYLIKYNRALAIQYFPIIHILNIILYCMFIVGFVCKRITLRK